MAQVVVIHEQYPDSLNSAPKFLGVAADEDAAKAKIVKLEQAAGNNIQEADGLIEQGYYRLHTIDLWE